MLAVVLAAFVVAFTFVIAALGFTGFHFAAFVCTFLGAVLAVGSGADTVLAVVLALVGAAFFSDLGDNGVGGFLSGVVVASGHTETESGSDHGG